MYLRDCWYVAGWSKQIGQRLAPVRMLGEDIVLYRTSTGEIGALEDACPHRKLPLSKGSLRDDTVVCGYHGLTFNHHGACVAAPTQERIPTGAAVRRYPAIERYGFVWLWMGAADQADESKLIRIENYGEPGWGRTEGGDMPIACNYLYIVDNLLDPAHVAWVHVSSFAGAKTESQPLRIDVNGDGVVVWRWMMDTPAPAYYAPLIKFAGHVDRKQHYECVLPSTGINKSIFSPAGHGGPDRPLHEKTYINIEPSSAAKDAQNPPNPRDVETQTWLYKGGLRDYLTQGLAADPIIPLFEGEQYASGAESDNVAEGEGAAWCVAFTDDGHTLRESYVNLIPTVAGGTHESGLKDGLFQAVKGFIELHSLMPKGVKLMPEDVFSRASFVLSAKVLDPQFQGQIKERLNSRDALRLVSNYVKPALELWLNQHVEHGKKLAELVIRQAQTRQRAGQKVEKRKGSGVAVLPGKLTDCESRDTTLNEVFLVEGDSAGGSAKMGRDKETQAILPLRGKVLNAWEVERDRLFANTEIHDIAVAVGVDPHGPADEPDFSGLRYGKVCILSDADVDGSHIQVLLLTLFFRHFPKLIERGHVYVAKPPLFRVDAPARGRKPPAKIYALDEGELHATLDKLRKEGAREGSWSISRFKGLGEMSAEQLWETTLNPETRRLLQVGFGAAGPLAVTQSLTRLMGKGEAAARRELMELHGDSVEVDV